ncbi:hypothetical protein FRC09_012643 [Ceratobasidium sp. 395]|nr:hypothetical protein FRC09_012643 [Ceratobasidium sp. 395]
MPEAGDSSQGSRFKYSSRVGMSAGGRRPTKQLATKQTTKAEAQSPEGPPAPTAEQVLEDVESALEGGRP